MRSAVKSTPSTELTSWYKKFASTSPILRNATELPIVGIVARGLFTLTTGALKSCCD